ncbi:MAG: hypothetical protein CMJ18_09810 [Phycisphaeraceae bacterium]|nr:hypothetical protein [Phycisphaeraceae bacterium]
MHDGLREFRNRVESIQSLERYLDGRRRSIGGPRTLAQAFVDYRSLLACRSVRLSNRDHDSICNLRPERVDWTCAYDWWQAREIDKDRDS